MNPVHRRSKCVNDSDRCRLGRLLFEEPCAWGDRTCRANLESVLEQATQVETRVTPHNVVTMNSKVRLVDLPTKTGRMVTLAYPDDVDLTADGVSVLEPLGIALLGSKVGDLVQCETAQGACHFRVVEIVFQPEQAGAFHL